jgi:hypothetical protein
LIDDRLERWGRRSGAVFSMSFVLDWPADASRETQVERTWRTFGDEMGATVQALLDSSRLPSEIAIAIGEAVRDYFGSHGPALTDAELRRLVADLFARHRPASSLVAFAQMPDCPWTGDEVAQSGPIVPDWIFGGTPSELVRFASGQRQSPTPIDQLWVDRSIETVFVDAFMQSGSNARTADKVSAPY